MCCGTCALWQRTRGSWHGYDGSKQLEMSYRNGKIHAETGLKGMDRVTLVEGGNDGWSSRMATQKSEYSNY